MLMSDNDDEKTQQNIHCKTLHRSGTVNNIDESLNEDIFDSIHYLSGIWKPEKPWDLFHSHSDQKVKTKLQRFNDRENFKICLDGNVKLMSFTLQSGH